MPRCDKTTFYCCAPTDFILSPSLCLQPTCMCSALALAWLNISAIEALVFMETANYNANVAKVLREMKI